MQFIRQVFLTFGRFIYRGNYLIGSYYNGKSIGSCWILPCWFWHKIMKCKSDIYRSFSHLIVNSEVQNTKYDLDITHRMHIYKTNFHVKTLKIYVGKEIRIVPTIEFILDNLNLCNFHSHLLGKDVIAFLRNWINMSSIHLNDLLFGSISIVSGEGISIKFIPDNNCGVPYNQSEESRILNLTSEDND